MISEQDLQNLVPIIDPDMPPRNRMPTLVNPYYSRYHESTSLIENPVLNMTGVPLVSEFDSLKKFMPDSSQLGVSFRKYPVCPSMYMCEVDEVLWFHQHRATEFNLSVSPELSQNLQLQGLELKMSVFGYLGPAHPSPVMCCGVDRHHGEAGTDPFFNISHDYSEIDGVKRVRRSHTYSPGNFIPAKHTELQSSSCYFVRFTCLSSCLNRAHPHLDVRDNLELIIQFYVHTPNQPQVLGVLPNQFRYRIRLCTYPGRDSGLVQREQEAQTLQLLHSPTTIRQYVWHLRHLLPLETYHEIGAHLEENALEPNGLARLQRFILQAVVSYLTESRAYKAEISELKEQEKKRHQAAHAKRYFQL